MILADTVARILGEAPGSDYFIIGVPYSYT